MTTTEADKIIVAILIATFTSFVAGITVAVQHERGKFAQTECAQYNPITSDFELIKNPKLKVIK